MYFNKKNNPTIQTRINKGNNLISFPSSYTVIDLETTGLSPVYDSIIEVSAIRIKDNQIVDEFSSVTNIPYGGCIYISDFITELTGITQEMVNNAPPLNDVLPEYLEFISDDIVIGHNVNFDINFLYDESLQLCNKPFTNDFVDTMRISRRLHPEFSHHRLSDLCERYLIDNSGAHRGLNDCLHTYHCFNKLKSELLSKYGDFESFIQACKKSSHGVRSSDIVATSFAFDESHPLYAKECVFTGKLERMTRKEAMQIVVNSGGHNRDTVTKDTNFLVLGNNDYCTSIKDGKSSKHKKAEKLKSEGYDIEIIPENVFYDIISDLPVDKINDSSEKSHTLSDVDKTIIDLTRKALKDTNYSNFRFEKKDTYMIGKCFYPLFKIKTSGKNGIYFVSKEYLPDSLLNKMPLKIAPATNSEWNSTRIFIDDLPNSFCYISEIILNSFLKMDDHIKQNSDQFYGRFKNDLNKYLNDPSLIKL